LLATPAGGQYRLTLADGTKVWLNSQSSIRFPIAFDGKTRLVEVTGEAYFDVAKDARRPFVVRAGKMIVQALGTQFNVHAYADEPSKATLIQGSVRVIKGADSLLLTPGQEGEYKEPGGIAENNTADTAQASAWKDGYFDFDNLDIQAIMRQFARWYDIRIVYQGKPSTVLFAGRLQRSLRLSQVMIGLGRMGVRSRLDGRTLTILR
jgi:ferric-dicitrate binding protein FerR (iron transport regulator)